MKKAFTIMIGFLIFWPQDAGSNCACPLYRLEKVILDLNLRMPFVRCKRVLLLSRHVLYIHRLLAGRTLRISLTCMEKMLKHHEGRC